MRRETSFGKGRSIERTDAFAFAFASALFQLLFCILLTVQYLHACVAQTHLASATRPLRLAMCGSTHRLRHVLLKSLRRRSLRPIAAHTTPTPSCISDTLLAIRSDKPSLSAARPQLAGILLVRRASSHLIAALLARRMVILIPSCHHDLMF